MQPLTAALAAKIAEQVDRTVHLIGFVPEDCLAWAPPIGGAQTLGGLLGHLMDCLAGFCAVLHAAHPQELAHFAALRELPLNRARTPAEACECLAVYRRHLDEGFALLTDEGLGRVLPTVFVPAGESVMTLLLGNLEHLVNHKHQLFMYLKLLGQDLATPDLYCLRG